MIETAFTVADNTKPSLYVEKVWNDADLHKIRKASILNERLYPAFYLNKHVNRALSMMWFLLRFPASPLLVREIMGGIGNMALESLNRVLPQAAWSIQDPKDFIGAMVAILGHEPS